MIRALDAGTKTMTRRVLNPQPIEISDGCGGWGLFGDGAVPRYAVGDRLWVREAWRADLDLDGIAPRYLGRKDAIRYEADQTWKNRPPVNGRLRPAMFMCRWMSRFTLTVVARKAERLQEISEEDALAEGIGEVLPPSKDGRRHFGLPGEPWPLMQETGYYAPTASRALRLLWASLHGLDAWAANPWVGAYTFSVEKRNIDTPVQGAKLASVAR